MHSIRTTMLLTALMLLLALPALALDTYQITINTGLVIETGDRVLIQAEGAMRVLASAPFMEGWFDPSGMGRMNRGGQVFGDSSYGMLIGSYYGSISNGFVVGDLASFHAPGVAIGNELKIGVNMSAVDLSSAEGAFKVHITRYQASEVDDVTLTIDADSPYVMGTGLISNSGDLFMVVGQGAAQVFGSRPLTNGWFDASGMGVLNRGGQIFPNTAYGSLLGTFENSLSNGFSIGDVAVWNAQGMDQGDELKVGLNMDADDLAGMDGSIVVHILRIGSGEMASVNEGDMPDAVVSLGNYPNPFNPMTTVRFELSRPQEVRISIVNVAGELVQTLSSQIYAAGNHHLNWDGRDAKGQGQASGIYFLRLETNETVQNHKLTLVR